MTNAYVTKLLKHVKIVSKVTIRHMTGWENSTESNQTTN